MSARIIELFIDSMSRILNRKLKGRDQPLHERAYHYIQRKTALRELSSGTPISETSLAIELSIIRTPVHKALKQLFSEGLLEESPGGGFEVVHLTPPGYY